VTETLSAWDRTPIACTRFCERDDLVHVGGTKDPKVDEIVALGPDLVIVDAEENRREDYDELVARGLAVHVLHVRSLDDVAAALTSLAQRLGVAWRAPALAPSAPPRVRAVVPIWRRPWMLLGTPTYGASLLAHLGVRVVTGSSGPYPTVSFDDAVACRADVVIAPSEPYPFTQRQRSELEGIAPTTFVDGKDLFWWGVRTTDAIARLSDQLSTSARLRLEVARDDTDFAQ